MALLEVQSLVKHFPAERNLFGRPTAFVKAVDGISFHVDPGETLALVGESGCGKSTASRLALRLIEPDSGSIRFGGRELLALDANGLRSFRRDAQIIFQDPYASLNPRMTLDQILSEPLALHDLVRPADRRARVEELLRLVGLEPRFARRYPHEFSGGQRQRIAIARALMVSPRLVVCDEPVSALDISVQAQVLNLLRELQGTLELSYLFISHDIAVVRHISHRIAVLYRGRIMEHGDAVAVVERPAHPYTGALLHAAPVPDPEVQRRKQKPASSRGSATSESLPRDSCFFAPRCPHVVDLCRQRRPSLEIAGTGRLVACHRWRELLPVPDESSLAAGGLR